MGLFTHHCGERMTFFLAEPQADTQLPAGQLPVRTGHQTQFRTHTWNIQPGLLSHWFEENFEQLLGQPKVDLFKLHPILLVLPEPLGRGVLSVVLPPKPMNEFSRQNFILNLKINYGYFGRFYWNLCSDLTQTSICTMCLLTSRGFWLCSCGAVLG